MSSDWAAHLLHVHGARRAYVHKRVNVTSRSESTTNYKQPPHTQNVVENRAEAYRIVITSSSLRILKGAKLRLAKVEDPWKKRFCEGCESNIKH